MPSDILGSGRRVFRAVAVCFLAAAVWSGARAQISPGELSAPHADLEGLSNCTRCHSLGKAVSSTKCLDCHTVLRSRIKAGTGLHAKYTAKECIECHKEHHGRDFSIVRFDTKTFDHTQTGYTLEGKHGSVQCEKCHARANVKATDVLGDEALMKAKTYLGLACECLACHKDEHKGQLSHECMQCHAMSGWKPAPKFNHDRAKFTLTGKHVQVQCSKCHKPSAGPSSPVQFVKLEFSRCVACHPDPHAGRFTKPCESCHTTAGWREGGARSFDHSLTHFPLRGKHASVKCEQCHGGMNARVSSKKADVFHIAKFSLCDDCHKDPHLGQFTRNKATPTCASCHTENSWKDNKSGTFDHAQTKFPLQGKHAVVSCDRCHGKQTEIKEPKTAGGIDVKKFAKCGDCHPDPHQDQFAKRPEGIACEPCHTESGFSPSKFTTVQHDKTRFALLGAHEAIPCVKCHEPKKKGDTLSTEYVRPKEAQCLDCHKDEHRDSFEGVLTTECTNCHSADRWAKMTYDHNKTKFQLVGKHVSVTCVACHGVPMRQQGMPDRWRFRDTPGKCVDCHPQGTTEGLN